MPSRQTQHLIEKTAMPLPPLYYFTSLRPHNQQHIIITDIQRLLCWQIRRESSEFANNRRVPCNADGQAGIVEGDVVWVLV